MSDNVKPITMSAEDEREDRFAAADKSGSGTCDPYRLECAWAEVDALRARVAELEAALADERKHADELSVALGEQLELRAVKATAHPLVRAHAARRAKEAAE